MKNKTLLVLIVITAAVNIAFASFLSLAIIFECRQPYFALFVTFFMFAYHIDIRWVIGLTTSIFGKGINIDRKIFAVHIGEYRCLERLGIKKWKSQAITLFPDSFVVQGRLNEDGIKTVLRNNIDAEITHWICFFASFLGILFGWLLSPEELWIYIITSLLSSLLFDLPFILIQRYNRYRLSRIGESLANKTRQ